MKEEKSKIKSDILLRVRLLYVLFILAGLSILLRLIWVQMFSTEVDFNAKRLVNRIFTQDTIPAQRGTILARNGEPLAISLFRYQVEMDFASEGLDSLDTYLEQSDSLSKLLANYFKDRSADDYRKFFREQHAAHYQLINARDTTHLRAEGFLARLVNRLRGEEFVTRRIYDTLRDHVPVKIFPREIDYNEWQELRKYPIFNWNMGMVYNIIEKDQRIYPHGELARRTIGLTGDQGTYGIEAVYKEQLAGTPGIALRQRIARGFYGRVVGSGNKDPLDGADVVSTLDLDLQDAADKALRNQLTAQNAIWGTAIVMQTHTGEVMALANLGRNKQGEYVENVNYAIAKRAELGSVFKVATMLALLEDAHMPTSTVYDTGNGGKVMVGGAPVQDSHGGFSGMDFKTAVAQSSNVYFAKAIWDRYANRKGDYSDFLRKLHLDRTVGLEAFGERKPLFPDSWKTMGGANQAFARLGFGYVIELTPMQMITLYNAVANDGQMVAPLLVREIRRNGEMEFRAEPKILVDSICSRKTLNIVRNCLEEVCLAGTAKSFFRDTTLFRAAGKTGTAQFSQDGIRYGDGYYMGSMVIYMPADKPRYTILVTMHTRRGNGAYYGGPLAGPVVKQLASYIYNREHEWHGHVPTTGTPQYPQHIKGGDIAQIRTVAKKLKAPPLSSDARTGWGRVQVDSLESPTIRRLTNAKHTVPDVQGMGIKEALFLLESSGLRVSFTGSGAVYEQSLAPEAPITAGGVIHLMLK
ncbi:MAG: penicillin-binding transpeptidase domain-containing protein [Alistipes sp.]